MNTHAWTGREGRITIGTASKAGPPAGSLTSGPEALLRDGEYVCLTCEEDDPRVQGIPKFLAYPGPEHTKAPSAALKKPGQILRTWPERFDFQLDLGLKLGQAKSKIPGTVPTDRHTTVPNDSGPGSACFDDDAKLAKLSDSSAELVVPGSQGYPSPGYTWLHFGLVQNSKTN